MEAEPSSRPDVTTVPARPPLAVAGAVEAGARRPGRRLALNVQLVVGLAVVVPVVLVAVLAGTLAPYDPIKQSLTDRLKPPGTWAGARYHVLGTDQMGRDLLSRIIHGARVSLMVSGSAVLVSGLVGLLLGLLAGYYRGRLDSLGMGLADLQLAFPFVLLAIAIIAVVGVTLPTLVAVLALSGWVIYARTERGVVLSLREREFVEAARALGAGDLWIMARHVLPNALAPALVIASVEVSKMILLEGTISFLGLGVQPPTPSWGNMLGEGRDYLTIAWWIAFFPGLALMITVMGVNFFADGLRDYLDPRQRRRTA